MRTLLVFALAGVAACSGGGSGDDAPGDDDSGDGGPDTGCTGSCATTAVDAMFAMTKRLNQAWYGVSSYTSTLYIEIDFGGPTSCPEESSPTPDYSLVMGSVPRPVQNSPVLFSGGAMLDYTTIGDLLGGPPVAQAMEIILVPDASNGDPAVADAHLAFDITGTFQGGTVTGHFYALHCASMDE